MAQMPDIHRQQIADDEEADGRNPGAAVTMAVTRLATPHSTSTVLVEKEMEYIVVSAVSAR